MAGRDWKLVIERQSRDLFAVIAELFALTGLNKGVGAAMLKRRVYLYVLGILGPAEAALRRLIIIAARGIELNVKPRGQVSDGAGGKAEVTCDSLRC
jgi:hypothetical protein